MCFRGSRAWALGGLPHVQTGNVHASACVIISLSMTVSICVQVYMDASMSNVSGPPQGATHHNHLLLLNPLATLLPTPTHTGREEQQLSLHLKSDDWWCLAEHDWWGKLQAKPISAWVHQVGVCLQAWRQLIEGTRWRRSGNQEVWRHSLTGQWGVSSVWAVWEKWLQNLDLGKGDCRTKAWFEEGACELSVMCLCCLHCRLWTNYVMKCRLKCKVLNKLCD